ncbi:ATP-dependent RNA helicase HrpA [Ferrovum sp. PN-J185]|uniref:ATP-dependent RNA helicase HrpA n=1 Tax=Ferrovum sp. PN-J185 TaxID=1356306 RepID=UPI00079367AD|nr:ATP-dependent RNA helicase HrpA [Ferrovum sp. PN-J185]KXW55371.1 ATP-dependent RNA helicase HrpB [Ferrovum sp. PN-J185]
MEKTALSPEFDGSLPIHEHLEEIQSLISSHQILILCGETGSGKTTQIPKMCLSLGFGQTKMIGCTQPRRLAARSVAQRLAFELKTEVGVGVGTKIRFQDRVNPKLTSVKVMTDGILLAEIHHDPLLKAYDVIIIDEAHERSLNIDFLLGYLKNLLPRRQDLKLIITSATIETEKFSAFFNGAPIVEVSGRSYPVDIRYRPPLIDENDEQEDEEERDTKSHLLHVIDDLMKETYQGDVLVFLPGERDIRDTLDSLKRQQPPHTEIVPLYARLSQEEQDKIFKTTGQRRIVLSTNVAETSLTVPGIRYVIDGGLVRVKRFSQRNKIDQLLIEKNSQASAQQRAGRSGRIAPGICVRLYSEEDYLSRPAFTTPELLRSSLAGVMLKMAYLELGEIEHFPFIDPPSPKAIQSGRIELLELGAIDHQYQLTALGKQIAKIPIDPHLGRILIAAQDYHSVTEALIITSFLSIQDPRERPFEWRQQADQQHKLFADPQSDFVTIINIWHAYLKEQGKSRKQQIRWCHEHFLNYKRMREWHELHHQIKQTAQGFHIIPNDKEATYEQLHRALLSGLISQIGYYHTELEHYQGVRSLKFKISKGSTLASKKPKWIMAADILDTGLLQARIVSQIQNHWVEEYAKQLMHYTLTPGEWDPQQGQAIAYENGSLYGLQIINRRKVSLSQRDPEQAHTLLLRHLCVLQESEKNIPDFIRVNHETIENVALIEHKTRRQDVLIDEEAIVNLYRQYIPSHITKAQELQNWYQKRSSLEKQQLLFTPDQLKKHNSISTTIVLYPDTLTINNHTYDLTYRFEPGHSLDGVTITVPLPLLVTLQESNLEWLVPGLIRDKIQQLIKGLPQQIRRNLVPVPKFITEFLDCYSEKNGSLKNCLEEFIAKRYQQKIQPDNWPNTLSDHLLMNIRVVDDSLQEIAQSRSLSTLKDKLKQRLEKEKQQLSHPLLQLAEITQWNFGTLPEYIDIVKQEMTVRVFPALVNENDHLFIRAVEDPTEAKNTTQQGIVRLFEIQFKSWLNNIDKNFSNSKEMGLLLSKLAHPPVSPIEVWLKKAWLHLLLRHCLTTFNTTIKDEEAFNQFYLFTKSNLTTYLNQLNNVHRKIIELAKRYYSHTDKLKKSSNNVSLTDIATHFESLMNWSMWTNLTFDELMLVPRYLEGLIIRLERYSLDTRQDLEKCKQSLPFKKRLTDHISKYGQSSHTKQFAKMLEEFYISLYAQPMKTTFPISLQRLEKYWTEHLK